MINFSYLKLRERILLGYAVPLLLTVATTGMVVVNARQVIRQNEASRIGKTLVRDSNRLETLLYERQAEVRGYLLTRDQSLATDYANSVRDYKATIDSLEQHLADLDPQQKERIQALKTLGEEISTINFKLIRLAESGNTAEVSRELMQGSILDLVAEASNLLNVLNEYEDKLQAGREQAVTNAVQSLIWSAVIGALSATVLAIAIGLLIASRISRSLNDVVSMVASSSTEIAVAVDQQEKTVAQQAVSVHQTTAAMDELSNASQQSAQQAESAAIGARQVLTLIDGTNQSEAARQNSHSLKARVGQIAERILYLSEQTNHIGSISTLVSDLANQTNMLALNAAVEASRAGEHGKGFGVIATEIRKLADQSRKSAARISTLVTDIQNATNSTVMVTDEGTKTVENIVSAVNEISLNNQQISLTAKQQAIAIQQVVDAMVAINQGASETASGLSQTKFSTQQLHEAALALKAVV
jgi:methyl-accepting chemotaxis protein